MTPQEIRTAALAYADSMMTDDSMVGFLTEEEIRDMRAELIDKAERRLMAREQERAK
jgi:hypothetical protein